jgi:hypothetical protein
MARSVIAVVTGYLIFAISSGLLFQLSGRDPHVMPDIGFFISSILWGVAFAMLGGFVASRIAAGRKSLHALGVAAMIAVTAVAAMLVEWNAGSVWSQAGVLLLMAPAAASGGYLKT